MSNIPAWIQAVAGAVQAAAALVIWRVTDKYVKLTHNLSATADKQLAVVRETRAADHRATVREFAYLAKRMAELVRALPLNTGIQNYGGLIVRGALWNQEDLAHLAALGARSGDSYANDSVQPLIDLAWLRSQGTSPCRQG